jgi:hypothetical protein
MMEGNKWIPNVVTKVRFRQIYVTSVILMTNVNSDCDCAKALQSQSLAGALLLKFHFHYFFTTSVLKFILMWLLIY